MINNFRKKIDKIDVKIAKQLSKRYEIVTKIAEYKQNNNIPVYNKEREEKHLEFLCHPFKTNKNLKKYIIEVFKSIFNISRDFQ